MEQKQKEEEEPAGQEELVENDVGEEEFIVVKKPRCACGKVFTTNRTLKRHQRSTGHETGVSIRVVCPFCEKKFTRRNYLRKHIRQQHNVNPNSGNVQLLEELSYNEGFQLTGNTGLPNRVLKRKVKASPVVKKITFVGYQEMSDRYKCQENFKSSKRSTRISPNVTKSTRCDVSAVDMHKKRAICMSVNEHRKCSIVDTASVATAAQAQVENGEIWPYVKVKTEPLGEDDDVLQMEDDQEDEQTLKELLFSSKTGYSIGQQRTLAMSSEQQSHLHHSDADEEQESHLQDDSNKKEAMVLPPVGEKKPKISIRRLACVTCNKRYASRKNLKRHIKETHGEKTLVCRVCELGFSRRYHLTRHMQRHHVTSSGCSKNDIPISTDKGEMQTFNKPELLGEKQIKLLSRDCDDVESEITLENGKLQTPVLRRQTSLKSTSKASRKRILSQKAKNVIKTITSRKMVAIKLVQKAKYKPKLVTKIRAVPKENKVIQNTICAIDSDAAELSSKRECASPVANKNQKYPKSSLYPFECSECDRSFMVKKSLKRHIKTKHKLEHLQCRICGYVFSSSRQDIFAKHMKKQHPNHVASSFEAATNSGDSLSDSLEMQPPLLDYYDDEIPVKNN